MSDQNRFRCKFRRFALIFGISFFIIRTPLNYAAIQGQIDSVQSSGQMDIRLRVELVYQLLGIDDINITMNNRGQSIRYRETICVGGPINSAYTITAQNLSGNGFYLSSSDETKIPYIILFYPDAEAEASDSLENAVRSRQYNVISSIQDCNNRDSSAIEFIVNPKENETPIGEYSSTLVLTVAAI